MPDRLPMEEACAFLRTELKTVTPATSVPTLEAAWGAFLRFGRQRFATPPLPDADGLLFQYGTHAFSGPPMFIMDFARQFAVIDDEGEHDHFTQIHCELRYESDVALDDLGSLTTWFFHDTGQDIDLWAESVERHLEPLLDRRPSAVEQYQERV
ncbi:hypothetical protein [Streptomyces albireticuli]|uniref:Uncharacterized protein n=1 Tax=Streptomyces albireticuli TaxID=1940 RepID=A0A2A2D3A9_9ACTN|nr:hypothetical protein [Streptomyces albireticuli]MCD9146056.1 hypothetical protein [Streptomyces albireticuli]MCD9165761.1 hypothetical protein [Streptomyces albireticuli]MCD9195979.1 hypothetical protein [Streptomyces albireticuli]PAU46923.1 hypothetical protein CK936_21760 [Streptomyces albireticuli]